MQDDTLVEALKALGHPLRLAIMRMLARGESNVGEIEEATGIGQPTLSQQLAILRKCELVATRRQAKQVFYSLDGKATAAIVAALGALVPVAAAEVPPGERTPSPGVANFARLSI
ncbi:MAG: winged helix-turn-helix transcriptional regulator [Erythrobacter sp.]|nr:winged helix-turn-helix transcriptional regulator [Erythrobacter sp.]